MPYMLVTNPRILWIRILNPANFLICVSVDEAVSVAGALRGINSAVEYRKLCPHYFIQILTPRERRCSLVFAFWSWGTNTWKFLQTFFCRFRSPYKKKCYPPPRSTLKYRFKNRLWTRGSSEIWTCINFYGSDSSSQKVRIHIRYR